MRTWSNQTQDDGSMHAMGNGQMLAYGQGPEMVHLYGPPYSSPHTLSLCVECPHALNDDASREEGTAIWNHHLAAQGKPMMDFTEFVDAALPSYVRLVRTHQSGVRWLIRTGSGTEVVRHPTLPQTWQIIMRPGAHVYNYPSNFWSFYLLQVSGACCAELTTDGVLVVDNSPGESRLIITGANEWPATTMQLERLLAEESQTWLERTRNHWQAFTQRRLAAMDSAGTMSPELLSVLDGVAVLLKAQQSSDGGTMAGPHYALAYIRDQYGTVRGMLSLGMREEARLNLRYRLQKWERFGNLHTAETMGNDCARHIHECDDVEGPSYTILQARDYLATVNDSHFADELRPMLEWCWQTQQPHATSGLLPFNGDETYVAGGFFPRAGLNQGSADTTLVYIEAGKWLAAYAVDRRWWTVDYANRQLQLVERARAAYRHYFWDERRIWANAPEREAMVPLPRFRHGVCGGLCGWFGWLERHSTGLYVCPHCLGRSDLSPKQPPKMEVNSVTLLPTYVGSDILSQAELGRVADYVLQQTLPSGHVPSVPGLPGCVGYDPGLLLICLAATDHPAAQSAYQRVLRILDSAGAWNEYYDEEDLVRLNCCRVRPWESGVNVAALVQYHNQRVRPR